MSSSSLVIAVWTLFATSAVSAQTRFFHPAATSDAVALTTDVAYGTGATHRMDVYRPAQGTAAATGVVFFNTSVGQRSGTYLAGWARSAAAAGLVAIVPDLRFDSAAADFSVLLGHLEQSASRYGIAADAITVFAASGNVFSALPLIQDPRQTRVKAAVVFYGAAPVREFRRDLPLLIVRAGLDRPALNVLIDSLANLALSQNAPVTVLNHAGGHHAFEIVDDNAGTRAAIDQAIAFLQYAAAPRYLVAVRSALPEASAAAYTRLRDHQRAAELYGDLVAQNPGDPALGLAYGEALLGAGRFAAACDQFEKLKDKGLGPRDLGLPAARACLNKGDPETAIEWLRTIPSRFLPPSVRTDTAFAALRDRSDFQALFQRSGPPPMP